MNKNEGGGKLFGSYKNIFNKKLRLYSDVLAGGIGVTTDVLGPAAGFVRVFDVVYIISNTLALPLAIVNADIVVPGPTAYRIQNTIASAAAQGILCHVLGNGEVLRLTNTGVNAGRISATYIDIPASNITLIRNNVTAALSTLIPEPTNTNYLRLLEFPLTTGNNRPYGVRLQAFNADTITHAFQILLNGVFLTRSATATTLLSFGIPGPLQGTATYIGSGTIQVQTTEAIITTPITFTGAYESLPQ